MAEKKSLRETIREKRRQLSDSVQQEAARNLVNQFRELDFLKNNKHIAAYYPHDGEIDPRPIIELIWTSEKKCYLPHIQNHKTLRFLDYKKNAVIEKNKYGIFEPREKNEIRTAEQLDLVLTPLVAFDKEGQRLGMGGGYYDKTFAFLKNKNTKKPFLLGLAYEWQLKENLPIHDHDIHLDAILTDKNYYKTGNCT